MLEKFSRRYYAASVTCRQPGSAAGQVLCCIHWYRSVDSSGSTICVAEGAFCREAYCGLTTFVCPGVGVITGWRLTLPLSWGGWGQGDELSDCPG